MLAAHKRWNKTRQSVREVRAGEGVAAEESERERKEEDAAA